MKDSRDWALLLDYHDGYQTPIDAATAALRALCFSPQSAEDYLVLDKLKQLKKLGKIQCP